jgi:hypothetical protein
MAAMDTIQRATCAQLVGLVYFSISNMSDPLRGLRPGWFNNLHQPVLVVRPKIRGCMARHS